MTASKNRMILVALVVITGILVFLAMNATNKPVNQFAQYRTEVDGVETGRNVQIKDTEVEVSFATDGLDVIIIKDEKGGYRFVDRKSAKAAKN